MASARNASTAISQHAESSKTPSMQAVRQMQQQDDAIPSSTPVEMSRLDSPRSPEIERWTTPPTSARTGSDFVDALPGHTDGSTSPGQQEMAHDTTPLPQDQAAQAIQGPSQTTFIDPPAAPATTASTAIDAPKPPASPSESKSKDTPLIGPASQDPATVITSTTSLTSGVPITLQLLTGERHPVRVDSHYLQKRNIIARAEDPFAISIYTLKESIWRDWRDEWDTRPTSPSAIRLIHLGKLLDDKQSLNECRFASDSPNVVHMTVKPADLQDDEDHAKGVIGGRGGTDDDGRRVGCRCCSVM